MKRFLRIYFLIIVPTFFMLSIPFLIYMFNSEAKLSFDNTTEFEAVVKDYELKNIGQNRKVVFRIEDEDYTLYISSPQEKFDLNLLTGIKSGTTIYYRVETSKIYIYDYLGNYSIEYLRTANKVILTLDESNKVNASGHMIMTIMALFVMLIFGYMAVYNIRLLMGKRPPSIRRSVKRLFLKLRP